LLINTEDIYTKSANIFLSENDRPPLPWSVKAQLQGRPGDMSARLFMRWAQLKMTAEEYQERIFEIQKEYFPSSAPLPGVPELLETLSNARSLDGHPIEMALATSSATRTFTLKTAHLSNLFKYFPADQQILGDNPQIPHGCGKPAPDIYLVALESINRRLRAERKEEISPAECLVFEDSTPGIEAGRRAGMRVVWVPHEELLKVYAGKEEEILAGIPMGAGAEGELVVDRKNVGESGDGWGELRNTLVGFDYERYGIKTSK